MDTDEQPKSDAERAAYAQRLVDECVARLDLAHAVAYLHFDAVRDGQYECRVLDPLGRTVAVLVGALDAVPTRHPEQPVLPGVPVLDAFDYTVTHVRTGGELLPVRPQPQPAIDANPYLNPRVPYIDYGRGRQPLPDERGEPAPDDAPPGGPRPAPDADADAPGFPHAHRHTHRAGPNDWIARNGFVIERYDHTHRHVHPFDAVPHNNALHDDHAH